MDTTKSPTLDSKNEDYKQQKSPVMIPTELGLEDGFLFFFGVGEAETCCLH